ncbi:MAG: PAS domain [Candidatus Alkanophagales archaeon MCA70_species_2]|nr:PAS domain [Candidatus Alkanophaga liquidiphilum]
MTKSVVHDALKHLPVAVFTVDADGRITSWNKAAFIITGFKAEDVVGNPCIFLKICPECRKWCKLRSLTQEQAAVEVENAGEGVTGEIKIIAKDGSKRWLLKSFHPLKDESGNVFGAVECFSDITSLKRREEELYKHARLLDNLYIYAGLLDERGRLLFANAPPVEGLGYAYHEVLGRHFWECGWFAQDARLRNSVKDAVVRALRGETVTFEAEIFAKDGSCVPIILNAKPFRTNEILEGVEKIEGVVVEGILIKSLKVLEQRLREVEELYRVLAEKTPVGIYLHRGGRFEYVNEQCAEMVGYSKEELLNMNFWETSFKEEQNFVREIGLRRLRGELEATYVEHRLVRKDGRIVWVGVYSQRVMLGGKPAVLGTMIDITERKEAELALKASEEKFRSLFNAQMDGIVIVDENGILLDINNRVVEFTGFNREEFIGKSFWELKALTEESKKKIAEMLPRRIRGEEFPPYEVEVVTKDGKIIPFEIHGSQILYEGRTAALAVFRDISERKVAETAIREAKERYEILFEESPDGLAIVEPNNIIIMANKELARMVGYGREEIVGSPWMKFVPVEEAERILDHYRRKREDPSYEVPTHYEVTLICKDGSHRIADLKIIEVFEGKSLLALRDITERKELEEELKERLEELEKFYKVTVHRELKMIELKKRIKELEKELELLKQKT